MTTPEDPRIEAGARAGWEPCATIDYDGMTENSKRHRRDNVTRILLAADAVDPLRAALRGDLPASGANLIATERLRQNGSEGWTPEHDAEHSDGELVDAAVCYLAPRFSSQYWPWRPAEFKPTPNDRVRELVKAGALIAAEIDRLNGETDG